MRESIILDRAELKVLHGGREEGGGGGGGQISLNGVT